MTTSDFKFAWPEHFNIQGTIDWTKPITHDLLFTDEISENNTAYFYSIVALKNKHWHSFYIGMVFKQCVSERHKQADHKTRLKKLQENHPNLQFLLTLGTPILTTGELTQATIEEIEGLLIFSNWHEQMVNPRKIKTFLGRNQIHIENTGWTKHLVQEMGYGVVYR
jgi:hypothetical protein